MRRRPVAIGMPSPRDRLREVHRPARIMAVTVMCAAVVGLVIGILLVGADGLRALLANRSLYIVGALVVLTDLYLATPWMRDVRGRVRLHLSGTFTLALVLICGPAAALLFPALSFLAQSTMRTATWRRVFNCAVLTLEGLVGSGLMVLVFGTWPAEPSALQLLAAGALVAVTWNLINVALVGTAQALLLASPIRPILRIGFRRTSPWLSTLVASPIIAFIVLHAPVLTPSLALIAVLTHHVLASTIRASDDARTDQLTGLANRTAALEELDNRLNPDESSGNVLVVMVDLDDFKNVNDDYGHAAGDHVLTSIASRLRAVVPEETVVARLGGDEFIIVGAETDDIDGLLAAIQVAVSEPLPLPDSPGGSLTITCAVGATVTAPGASPMDPLRIADGNMYRHKRQGTGRDTLST